MKLIKNQGKQRAETIKSQAEHDRNSNSNFATEGTENTEENCRGLIYQALPTSNSPVGFDESNPYDRIYLTKVGHFRIRQNQN